MKEKEREKMRQKKKGVKKKKFQCRNRTRDLLKGRCRVKIIFNFFASLARSRLINKHCKI